MEQRVSIVTLGVADLHRARALYERLGWAGQEVEETVFFQAGGLALVLWSRQKLALDAGVADEGSYGFAGITLAHNVRSKAEVDAIMASARQAGATVTGAPSRGDLLWRLCGLLHRPRRPYLGDRPQPGVPARR